MKQTCGSEHAQLRYLYETGNGSGINGREGSVCRGTGDTLLPHTVENIETKEPFHYRDDEVNRRSGSSGSRSGRGP